MRHFKAIEKKLKNILVEKRASLTKWALKAGKFEIRLLKNLNLGNFENVLKTSLISIKVEFAINSI